MKKCKKCGKSFEPQKGLKNYCSLSCRNSREMTDEKRKKISNGVLNSDKYSNLSHKHTSDFYEKISKKRKENDKIRLLNEDFENLSFGRLRKRVIIEQDEKCNKCGLSEWFGEKLSLELEHKDGNNKNNSRDNLEALCPNCHSITPTWRGRNIKNKKQKITDKILLKALIENNFNMRKSLISVNIAAKGGNYKRCHRLKKEYEILHNNEEI